MAWHEVGVASSSFVVYPTQTVHCTATPVRICNKTRFRSVTVLIQNDLLYPRRLTTDFNG